MSALIETPLGTTTKNGLNKLRADLAQYNRTLPVVMTPIETPDSFRDPRIKDVAPLRAWRSAKFIACLFREPGKPAYRLSVCRAMLLDNGRYDDAITWDELQGVKEECGFADYDAVEVYPRAGDLVNVSNMRHLWILDDLCPLAWR